MKHEARVKPGRPHDFMRGGSSIGQSFGLSIRGLRDRASSFPPFFHRHEIDYAKVEIKAASCGFLIRMKIASKTSIQVLREVISFILP